MEMGKIMQFSSLNAKNDIRCKRFDRLISNKKQCEMVLKMCTLTLFQFPMGTYLFEMNM
jgi:hypothetical protein